MKQIPNIFTLLNLVFGSMAIVFILQTGEGIVNHNGEEWKVYLPEKIWWGSVCIGIAALVDFLDGAQALEPRFQPVERAEYSLVSYPAESEEVGVPSPILEGMYLHACCCRRLKHDLRHLG